MSARILELHATLTAADPAAEGRAWSPGDAGVLTLHATVERGHVRWPDAGALATALGQKALVGPPRPAAAGMESSVLGAGVSSAQSWDVQLLLPPGEHELGPFPLAVVDEGGAVVAEDEVPAVTVKVASALPSDVAEQLDAAASTPDGLREAAYRELAPVRGPWAVDAPTPWLSILLGILAVAAAIAAAWALVAWWRRRRQPTVVAAVPLEPPEVVARRRLQALRESGQLEAGSHHAFHVELADIVKSYLTQRLGADLVDLTTHEVRQALAGPLRERYGIAPARAEIVGVLAACDLVKFARHVPRREDGEGELAAAERIIERTTPPALPETSAEAARAGAA